MNFASFLFPSAAILFFSDYRRVNRFLCSSSTGLLGFRCLVLHHARPLIGRFVSRYIKMPNTARPPMSSNQHLGNVREQSVEYSSAESDNDQIGANGSLKRKRPLTVSCVPESLSGS